MQLLKALAQRLRRITETNTNLVFTDVPGRVAKALLELAGKFGMQTEEGIQVNHDLTQEELAQLVGASRETVNKALADFAPGAGSSCRPSRCCCSIPTGCRRQGAASAARRPELAPQRSSGGASGRRLGLASVRRSSPVGQVAELGLNRDLGEWPQRAVHVGVDPGHDVGPGAVARGQSCPDLGESLGAVRYVKVKGRYRVAEQRTVTWQQRPQAAASASARSRSSEPR